LAISDRRERSRVEHHRKTILQRVNVLRTFLVLAQVYALSGTLGAQQPPASPTLNTTEQFGRKIFQTRCAMCHVGQEPATEMATDGAARRPTSFGPLLSQAQAANEEKLREKIKNGGARMPAYKLALNDEQIGQVVAFMKTLGERPLTKLATARPGQ
jgi:mono/diheme cytochrome c family protein